MAPSSRPEQPSSGAGHPVLPLSVVGVSHQTASVGVRERLTFGETEVPEALRSLREEAGVEEAVLLSTCNRTEIYLFPALGDAPLHAVRRLLTRKAGAGEELPLDRILFQRSGEEAVRHLFHVSSGLDSMVTGEAEIQGQVREAYLRAAALALDPPMAGPVLNRLFQMALAVGGRVRSETPIGEGRASVAFSQLRGVLPHVDIVLATTAAPDHVVTREIFDAAFPSGPRRPLFMIDIAVPRDIDPSLAEEAEVFLYNLDDLQRIVEETVRVREGAVPQAQGIIEAHSLEFRSWYASLEVIPVIRKMRSQAEEYRSVELDRLFRGMEHLPHEDRARVEEFSRRLLNKLLHDPLVQLRRGIAREGRADLVEAVRFLYGMDAEPDDGPADPSPSHEEPTPRESDPGLAPVHTQQGEERE